MKTVAIIGASADRAKFGNKSIRAHARAGYHVYPINPRETEIEGWHAFRSVRDLPVKRPSGEDFSEPVMLSESVPLRYGPARWIVSFGKGSAIYWRNK